MTPAADAHSGTLSLNDRQPPEFLFFGQDFGQNDGTRTSPCAGFAVLPQESRD
jgi:hypothetical protein